MVDPRVEYELVGAMGVPCVKVNGEERVVGSVVDGSVVPVSVVTCGVTIAVVASVVVVVSVHWQGGAGVVTQPQLVIGVVEL